MALVTKKDFEHDAAKEEERYKDCLEAGFPEDEARANARFCGEPIGIHERFPADCLLCGKKLVIPFIFWAGQGADIGLHIECATHLSLALKRDVIEHQCGRDQAQQWYSQAKAEAIRRAGK
jgi:hypothetical protein